MSEEEAKTEEKTEVAPITTLQKIQLLANLANGVQDGSVKELILALPSGELLYHLFVAAVSREIENMMDKQAPSKEIMDALSVAQNLKQTLSHLYGMVAEINRSQVLGVLSLLNQNLGGNPLPPAPQPNQQQQVQQQQYVQQQQAQQAQQQQSDVPRTVRRSNDTGLSW
jgi:hypothetical protein